MDSTEYFNGLLSSQNIFNNDPRLDILADNGGLTRTHRLLSSGPASPAIDAGSNSRAIIPFTDAPPSPGIPLTTDQRGLGFVRRFNVPGIHDPDDIVDMGAYELQAAKVIDVTISKSGANPAFNPAHHFAADNAVGPIVGSGRQLQTVPVGGADTISITFSDDVTIQQSHLSILGIRYGSTLTPATSVAFSYANRVATWKFQKPAGSPALAPVMPADHYRISLSDAVTAFGAALDGDWKNPGRMFVVGSTTTYFTHAQIDTFPSGNGTPGGAFNFVFTILQGDATLNNLVNERDVDIFNLYYNQSGQTFTHADFTGDGFVGEKADGTFVGGAYSNLNRNLQIVFSADFDGDGDVDGADLATWQSHYGSGTTHETGDADFDGVVDGDDWTILQQQFGWTNTVFIY